MQKRDFRNVARKEFSPKTYQSVSLLKLSHLKRRKQSGQTHSCRYCCNHHRFVDLSLWHYLMTGAGVSNSPLLAFIDPLFISNK